MNKCPRCGKENTADIHTCTPPLALCLADNLARPWTLISDQQKAAAELRRLNALNAELVKALEKFIDNYNIGSPLISWDVDNAEELLAKAKEQT